MTDIVQRASAISSAGDGVAPDFWPLLNHLHRGGQYAYWWTNPGKVTTWFRAGQPAPLPLGAHNSYFGVHPVGALPARCDKGEPIPLAKMRALSAEIAAINCLYAEFVAKDFVTEADLEPTVLTQAETNLAADQPKQSAKQRRAVVWADACAAEAARRPETYMARALAHVRSVAVAPSVIVDSGGGYHGYWLLAEPFVLGSQADRARARRLQVNWVNYVGSDPAAKDLARALRVPGTTNHKYQPPRLVTLLEADFKRLYRLPDLEVLARPPEPLPAGNGYEPGINSKRGNVSQATAGDYWLGKALARVIPHAGDLGRSGTGFWLACQLRDTGLGEIEAEPILREYAARVPSGHDDPYTEQEALASLRQAYLGDKREPARSPERRAREARRQHANTDAGQTRNGSTEPPEPGGGRRLADRAPATAAARPMVLAAAESAASTRLPGAFAGMTAPAEPGATPGSAPSERPTPQRTAQAIVAELEMLKPAAGKPERAKVESKALDLVAASVELSKADLQRIMSTLRSLGCTQEFARNWQAAVREARATPSGVTGGSPSDGGPYEADEGHLYHISIRQTEAGPEVERTVISDFAAEIIEEATAEDGRRWYTIAGTTADGRPFRLAMPAERFADERELQAVLDAAAGAYAPVRAKMAAHLRPAIKLLTRARNRVRQTRRFERTGWHEGRFLIPGREPTDSTITLDAKLAYCIPAEADLAQGLAALRDLIEALDARRTTVTLAGLFVGPLAALAGWVSERFAQLIVGRTGSLKTSHTQTAMCIYGDFMADARLLKWGEGATRNSLLKYAAKVHDLPLLLANFKPSTGDGSRGFTNLVHNLIEGTDKDRLNRAAELRPPAPIRCWPTFTGEDVPADDPATIARLLVIRYKWDGQGENAPLARAQAAAGHLPAVGGAWLAWLETAEGQRIAQAAGAQFAATRGAWMRLLVTAEPQTPNAARIASNLAINQLTWWVLRQHPTIGPVLEPYTAQHEAGLAEIASDMARRTKIAREAVRFLATVAELLISGRCVLAVKGARPSEPPERVIGWRDAKTDTIYLLPDVAKKEVLKVLGPDGLGILSDNALHEQIADMGLIASHDPDRFTKVARVEPGGKTIRLLHLYARAAITTVSRPAKDPEQATKITGRLAELDAERIKLHEDLERLTGVYGEETGDA